MNKMEKYKKYFNPLQRKNYEDIMESKGIKNLVVLEVEINKRGVTSPDFDFLFAYIQDGELEIISEDVEVMDHDPFAPTNDGTKMYEFKIEVNDLDF